jgi:ABC-type polar amino acid transport system ATPase subunit
MSTIEISGLHKSFGALEVLRGIDLAVEPGEVVCVIGPSGSGKSTLLRCVNLLEEPTAGSIRVAGVEVTDPDCDIDAVRRGIGMVFQQFNLFGHLTVRENVTIAQRRVPGAAVPRPAGSPPRTSPGSACSTRRTPTRLSCPVGSSSGPRSPGPWRWTRN